MCDYGSDTTLDLMWIPIHNSILTFVPTEPSLQMQIFRRCPFKVPTYVHKGAVCNMMGLTFAAYRGISNAASRVLLLPFMTEDGLFVANFMPKWAWEIISPTVRCVKRINPIIPRPSRFQKERGQRRRRQHLPCRRGSVPIGAQWYPTLSPLQPRHRSYCHSPWWCSLFLLLLNSWWLSFQFPLFPTTSIHIYIRTLPNGILTWRGSCFNVIHFGAFSLLNCSWLRNQPIEIQMKGMKERNTCRVLSRKLGRVFCDTTLLVK